MTSDLKKNDAVPAGVGGLEPLEGDFIVRDFPFTTGEPLADLRLHYTTLGTPVRDAEGVVRNAVLILHGTGGNGRVFLNEPFAGVLFGPGQPLDATRHYIVLPDGIGHGQSSKPSDGLRARFPRYTYADMVCAQHRLLTEGLGVNHLRLVMGTSMGGMHTWMWGELYPQFMDALMPLASLPAAIAGRNRMMRRMVTDAIRNDPEWRGGDYREQPRGLLSAIYTLLFMVSVPLQWQQQASTPGGRRCAVRPAGRGVCREARCQRRAVSFRRLPRLRPGPRFRADRSAAARDQFRRRPGQPAGARHPGKRDPPGKAGAAHPDPH